MNSGRPWHDHIFFKDRVLAPAAEMCPGQSQAFKTVKNGQAFPQEEKRKKAFFFIEPVGGTPRHVCTIFRAKSRRSYRSVFNITRNITKKPDSTLKPSYFEEIT